MKRRAIGGKKKLFLKRFYPAGNYTWTVPAGCTEVDVFLVGAGGGSGGYTNMWGAWGAGGGGYTKTFRGKGYIKPASGTWMGTDKEGRDGDAIIVTPGQIIPIIVGAGVVNGNGGYTQFMNNNYRADGGKTASSYTNGGDGGSAGGSWWSVNNFANGDGATDGGSTLLSTGQGHTTRDFGEPSGKRNAGGGSTGYAGPNDNGYRPNKGASDYIPGSGQYPPNIYVSDKWLQVQYGGGGYGGGASSGNNSANNGGAPLSGGDGTVLLRYWAYEE